MIGSYVDLYRVKLGAAKRKNYSTVFKDFGYKAVITGSSGRPKQPRITRWARSKTVCRCCWNWTRA